VDADDDGALIDFYQRLDWHPARRPARDPIEGKLVRLEPL